MPSIKSATNAVPLTFGKGALTTGSIWAGGAAVGGATGFNPVTASVGLALGNPMDTASLLLTVNPFQRIQNNRFGLSRAGMFGYKTLIRGVQGGASTLTAGNLILSSIQGTARLLGGLGQLGEGSLATSLKYARTLGISGIIGHEQSVIDLVGEMRKNPFSMYAGVPSELQEDVLTAGGRWRASGVAQLKSKLQSKLPSSTKKLLSKLSGAGVISASNVDEMIAKGLIQVEGTGVAARVIVPGLSETVKPKGVFVGKIDPKLRPWLSKNIRVRAYRGMWRLGSFMAWAQLTALIAAPVAGAALSGVSNMVVTALDFARNFTNLDITSGRLPQVFMTNEAATERQRAVQAIYGARVSPSNRFLGNEAQMYHS